MLSRKDRSGASCSGERRRNPPVSIVRWTGLATITALLSGCVLTPTRPESSRLPAESAESPENPGTTAADVASRTAPSSEFHKTATERQRFQVHIDFGRVFESQGNFDAAALEYQSALAVAENRRRGQLKPADEALAHRRMGGALDQLGRFAQAEVHFKKALKLSPRDPRVWNNAGYSYYLQGRWAEAEGALKTAARFAPDDERIRTNLGLTLAAAGRTSEALPLLSHTAGDAIGHMNLGYALAAHGQTELARQQYEIALAQRPELEHARRALAQLDRQQGPTSGTGTLMAGANNRAIDRSVNQASGSRVRTTAPPLPSRSLPEAQPAGQLAPAESDAGEFDLPPLPPLSGS
jgi:Flp pilus assembly protein TadD